MKNGGFSYLYGSVSYLFGYENIGCFSLIFKEMIVAHVGIHGSRFSWLTPIRNSFKLRGIYSRSYFGPRTCGGDITNVIEVGGVLNQGFPFSLLCCRQGNMVDGMCTMHAVVVLCFWCRHRTRISRGGLKGAAQRFIIVSSLIEFSNFGLWNLARN